MSIFSASGIGNNSGISPELQREIEHARGQQEAQVSYDSFGDIDLSGLSLEQQAQLKLFLFYMHNHHLEAGSSPESQAFLQEDMANWESYWEPLLAEAGIDADSLEPGPGYQPSYAQSGSATDPNGVPMGPNGFYVDTREAAKYNVDFPSGHNASPTFFYGSELTINDGHAGNNVTVEYVEVEGQILKKVTIQSAAYGEEKVILTPADTEIKINSNNDVAIAADVQGVTVDEFSAEDVQTHPGVNQYDGTVDEAGEHEGWSYIKRNEANIDIREAKNTVIHAYQVNLTGINPADVLSMETVTVNGEEFLRINLEDGTQIDIAVLENQQITFGTSSSRIDGPIYAPNGVQLVFLDKTVGENSRRPSGSNEGQPPVSQGDAPAGTSYPAPSPATSGNSEEQRYEYSGQGISVAAQADDPSRTTVEAESVNFIAPEESSVSAQVQRGQIAVTVSFPDGSTKQYFFPRGTQINIQDGNLSSVYVDPTVSSFVVIQS